MDGFKERRTPDSTKWGCNDATGGVVADAAKRHAGGGIDRLQLAHPKEKGGGALLD